LDRYFSASLPNESVREPWQIPFGVFVNQRDNVLHRPQAGFDPRSHRPADAQGLVDPHEVVPERIARDDVSLIFACFVGSELP
jgi:hypothetical protein